MSGYSFYGNPADSQPAAQPAAPPPKPAGPTGFWQRIGMVGIGKVNALNAYKAAATATKDTGKATNATGRFLFKGTAKLANQGYQEGKQAVDTTKMEAANITHNPAAFSNANKQSQADYKGFNKNKGGLFNVGTATSEAGAKRGDLKTGVKDIGGATLESAGEIIPMAKIGAAAKVYKLSEGVTAASEGAMKTIGKNAVLGAISGAAGNTGADLLQNGRVNFKDTAKGAAIGAIIGGGSTAIAKGIGALHSIFKAGPTAALDKITGKAGKMSGDLPKAGMTDVMGSEGADKAATAGKIPVRGAEDTGTPIHVGTPVKMTGDEYAQRFNALSKSYDKAYSALEKKPPATQKLLGTAIDNQHIKALEQLNHDYIHGTIPGKAVKNAGQKLVSEQGGARPQNALQTKLETAHNAGDTKGEADAASKLKDPALAGKATVSKSAGAIFMDAQKSGKPISMAEARSQAAAVDATPTASIEQKISRPATPGESSTPPELSNINKAPAKGFRAAIQSRGAGTFNPELAAARQGNTEFSGSIRKIASGDALANSHAHDAASKFEGLYNDYLKNGGSHEQFIKDVESGKMGTPAHQFWAQHYQTLGKQLTDSGVLKSGARDSSYVPRIAKFNDKAGNPNSMGGLRKTGGFAKGRAQESVDELGHPTGDLYKTHGDFKQAVEQQGGKVMTNPVEIMRQSTAARLKAINHADGLAELDKTPMRDARPATITFSQKDGLPAGYRDYNTTVLPGRAVHPEAVKGVTALTKTSSLGGSPAEQLVAKGNSIAKRLVTLNGLVHGKNFALASIREQGLRGTATAFKQYSEEDVNRAIEHGFVPSRAGMTNIFDEANDGKGALGKATGVFGKLYNKQQKLLFEGFGDKLGMNTYLHIEKNLISKGLSQSEAGKIAADTANRVIFSQRSTETSAAMRETARLALFAGKFFQSTLAIGTKATGLGKNNALSEAAQKIEQRQAAKAVARGFTYLFGAAQAINYATTGHSTFQNKDSKISPVFYVDKSTGKEYHITNFFGQIGELMNLASPKTLINKSSPMLQEVSKIMTNTDPFKGTPVRDTSASGPRQIAQVFANILENAATPLGFQMSTLNQSFGAGHQPGAVTGAKLLGYGTSTKDQTPLEKNIDQQYYKTLPAGQGAASDQQLALAEARARQDLKAGKTSSANVQEVKSKLSPTSFKKFMNTGAASSTQRHFESLPTEQKLQLIQKFSPNQLKELDFTSLAKSLTGSSAKTTVESLQQKGFNAAQINQILIKIGYGPSQLEQIKQEAKIQARQQSAKTRYQPKWQNPLLK